MFIYHAYAVTNIFISPRRRLVVSCTWQGADPLITLPRHQSRWQSTSELAVYNSMWSENHRLLDQWIDDQAAKQLGVEVGALGRHSFAMFTDLTNVTKGRGHHQGGQRER